ncbi:DUF5610 domain-containing protein [Psychromonas sp. Urea-02u-13]|uniref:DUF5610 domain-containing protein n=1 Tax=Psychromonas sp. Urea-02u-13 TaxID=2058326 RepID=UPI000C32BDCE|nr:DUF5610 domain-containing protein [Psychromonas sp. Urea-02u-13]PKG39315.1 hypothetical protein CXF74_09140 [Psychromonas sp. Urea-02u-13]
MKVDMQNFQPLAMFNQLTQGNVKIASDAKALNDNHIDKNNVAANVVNNRLNEALGLPAQGANKDVTVFDFETVTKNILNVVTGAINNAKNNGATEGELNKMLSDAQKGMKEGLNGASKELAELGLLTSNIKQGIDETAKQLTSGLNTFADEILANTDSPPMGLTSYKEASHYNLTKDASFKFITKEGDQVNITFNSEYLQQNVSVSNLTENGLNHASSQKTSSQTAFSFEVNGELNEDEQQTINKLLGSLQNVSDLFFNGDLEDAFDEAQTISMDPTHLAAFSMDLNRSETVASIKEYQKVMPGKELAQNFRPINDELTQAYEQAKPFAIEEHLTELLQWLAPDDKESDNLLEYSESVFEQLANLASQRENR